MKCTTLWFKCWCRPSTHSSLISTQDQILSFARVRHLPPLRRSRRMRSLVFFSLGLYPPRECTSKTSAAIKMVVLLLIENKAHVCCSSRIPLVAFAHPIIGEAHAGVSSGTIEIKFHAATNQDPKIKQQHGWLTNRFFFYCPIFISTRRWIFWATFDKMLTTGSAVRIFWNLFLNLWATFSTKKKKCSDSPENSTNRPDDIKSVPNLVSDRFFDFLKNWVPEGAGFQCVFSSRNVDMAPQAEESCTTSPSAHTHTR